MDIADQYYFKNKTCKEKMFSRIPLLKLLYHKIPKYPPDFVSTPHNKGFAKEENFVRAYKRAIISSGWDYRIPWRVHQAIWAAHSALEVKGDFVELGTGKGFIMSAVLESIDNWNNLSKYVYLFDVFQPQSQSGIGKEKHSQYYATNVDEVKKNFQEWKRVEIVPGDISDTIKKNLKPKLISFLHVDLNSGEPEIYSIKELWSKISDGGIILLDDYANLGHEVQYDAHNKLFKSLGRPVLTTPSGQGIVIK